MVGYVSIVIFNKRQIANIPWHIQELLLFLNVSITINNLSMVADVDVSIGLFDRLVTQKGNKINNIHRNFSKAGKSYVLLYRVAS